MKTTYVGAKTIMLLQDNTLSIGEVPQRFQDWDHDDGPVL